MKKNIHLISVLLMMLGSIGAAAQDIHFSQIFETPILRNPSLAGIFSGDVRIQSVYRTQWNSVTDPYKTTSLSGEVKKSFGYGDDYMTFGGQILYDRAGEAVLTSTHVLPAINFHKSLSDERNTYISLGFMGGIVQRRIDRSKMTTNSQYDGTAYNPGLADGENFSKPSYSFFDGTVGMSFNSQIGENAQNNFFAGVAYHHFNKAKRISFYSANDQSMTPKWVLSSGIRMSMTDKSFFTIQADYSKQGSYQEVIGGALYSWKLDESENSKYVLHAGAYIRWKDALIPVAKIECRPLAISVSYDANISELKSSSNGQGGFEVALTYQCFTKQNSSRDAVRCPKF
jgi:type IX secretion system PorP/SprF family membrane protein